MKVVCVDDSDNGCGTHCILPNGKPLNGEIYTVISRWVSNRGCLCYDISEKPVVDPTGQAKWGWEAHCFVPASYYQAEFCVKEENHEPATA